VRAHLRRELEGNGEDRQNGAEDEQPQRGLGRRVRRQQPWFEDLRPLARNVMAQPLVHWCPPGSIPSEELFAFVALGRASGKIGFVAQRSAAPCAWRTGITDLSGGVRLTGG